MTREALLVFEHAVIRVALASSKDFLHLLSKLAFEQFPGLSMLVVGKNADFIQRTEFTVQRDKWSLFADRFIVARDT